MKSPRLFITWCFLFSLLALSASAQTNKITPGDAQAHVGEVRAVCGKVASTHFAHRVSGSPHS